MDSLAYLGSCGISVIESGRCLIGQCAEQLDIVPVFMDYKDIAHFIGQDRIHMGITTTAALAEKESPAVVVRPLGFSQCRLAFAAAAGVPNLHEWHGQCVVAQYPNLARKFFNQCGKNYVQVITISGSAEVYPSLGIADGIVDLVQSGESLKANNLSEIHTIMPVQAVLVRSPEFQVPQKLEMAFGG